MTDQSGHHPEHEQADGKQPFMPDGKYAAQALREQLVKERQEHRDQLDGEIERSTYLRAVMLQMQDEAATEIQRRDAIVEAQALTIEQLRSEAQNGRVTVENHPEGQDPGPAGEGPLDDLDADTRLLLDGQVEWTVSTDQPAEPADTLQDDVRDVTPETARITRDGNRSEPIPEAPEGLTPDPDLVPSGVELNSQGEVPLSQIFGHTAKD